MALHDDVSKPARILLVEDGQVQTLLIKAALADVPQLALLYVARDGAEAIELLRREARSAHGQLPDVILLDVNMPGKDGFDVLAEIKPEPLLRRIPIIVFTTSECQEDVDRAYELGANSFVAKPVTLDGLGQVLRRIADYWVETARLPTGLQGTEEKKPRIWRSAG